MKKKKKIQVKFINNNPYKKVMSIDKQSLKLFAEMMRGRYGKV